MTSQADLTGADLTGADLTGADLTGAVLTGADFAGANLQGTLFPEDYDVNTSESSQIVFVSNRNGNSQIFVVDENSSNFQELTSPEYESYDPDWSSDKKRIVYISNQGDGDDLYVIDIDGSNSQQLTFSEQSEETPRWSPDGTKIAYTASTGEEDKIFVYDLSTERTTAIEVQDFFFWPLRPDFSWSPDSSHLAFYAEDEDSGAIGLWNIEDKSYQWVLDSELLFDAFPIWSPDGTTLSSVIRTDQSDDPNFQIFTISTDGSNFKVLAEFERKPYALTWSPDSQWIAFIKDHTLTMSEDAVFVIGADGQNLHQVTENDIVFITYLDWSPDGRNLVFSSDFYGSLDLFTINTDGTNLRRLTSTDGWDIYPIWK